MEVTNIKEEAPQEESVVFSFVKWSFVWLVIYLVVGGFGGLFRSSPSHIPPGMTWQNQDAVSYSTFYILRGGPHLILELNQHSQRYWAMLIVGMAVMFMYLFGQALKGKLKNRQGELLPDWGQKAMALFMLVVAASVLWWGLGGMLKKQTLEFDPASHQVTLNDSYLCPFEQVTGFRSYVTHGSKGSINYHLVMECAGEEIHMEGSNAHSDMDQMAGYLNAYLADARRQQSSD